MRLCDINNKAEVEAFKNLCLQKLENNEFFWVLLETKVIPKETSKRRAFALCHAYQIRDDSYKLKLKIAFGGEIDFGDSFESAQKAIITMINYCLLIHSQPKKIGPRESIYLPENDFTLELFQYWYNKDVGFYDTNVCFFEGYINNIHDVKRCIEMNYRSFDSLEDYDKCTANLPTVSQREQEYLGHVARNEAISASNKMKNEAFDRDNQTLNTVMFTLKFILYPIPYVGILYFIIDKLVRRRPEQISERFYVIIILLIYSILISTILSSIKKMIMG